MRNMPPLVGVLVQAQKVRGVRPSGSREVSAGNVAQGISSAVGVGDVDAVRRWQMKNTEFGVMRQGTIDPDIKQPEELAPIPRKEPRGRGRYLRPRELWGDKPGETCKTCGAVLRYHAGKHPVIKCDEWIQTASSATDIRLKWPACAKWRRNDGRTE